MLVQDFPQHDQDLRVLFIKTQSLLEELDGAVKLLLLHVDLANQFNC